MKGSEVEVGVQTQPQAHRRQAGVGAVRREVGRWMDVAGLGARDGDAQGVVDAPGVDFVVAGEQRKDRQAGGVGGGPAFGTQGVAAQVEDGA